MAQTSACVEKGRLTGFVNGHKRTVYPLFDTCSMVHPRVCFPADFATFSRLPALITLVPNISHYFAELWLIEWAISPKRARKSRHKVYMANAHFPHQFLRHHCRVQGRHIAHHTDNVPEKCVDRNAWHQRASGVTNLGL